MAVDPTGQQGAGLETAGVIARWSRALPKVCIHPRTPVAVPLLVLAAALLLLTCAVPVRNWQTGEAADRPLPLASGGPHVDRPSRVWIDTDAACNGGSADPDDCFAMLALMNAPEVEIVGISTVFGNAPLPVVDQATRDLIGRVV